MSSSSTTPTYDCYLNKELSKHLFLIPAGIILLILALLNKRKSYRKDILGGRLALVIPYNFLGFDSNRFSIVAIFGAATGLVIDVVLRVATQSETNNWTKASRMIGECLEVAVLCYPMFACLTTRYKVIGSIMGFLYTSTWFGTYLVRLTPRCDPESSFVMNMISEVPVILCYLFVLVKYLKILYHEKGNRFWNESQDGDFERQKSITKPWLVKHVSELLCPRFKVLEKRWVYYLRCFYSPERFFSFSVQTISVLMICSIFLYQITLALFFEAVLFIKNDNPNKLVNSCTNGVLVIVGISLVVSTMITGLLCCFSLVCFMDSHKNNMVRVFKGDLSFIPKSFSKSQLMVGKSMKYAGFQIAFFMWGYLLCLLVIGIVVFLLIFLFDCHLFWELFKNLLANFASVLVITIIIWILVLFSSILIFRDRAYPKNVISLDNRNLYLVFSYFFFFLALPIGCFAALRRLLKAMAIGFFMLPRIDRSVFPGGFQRFDRGYAAYISYLHVLAAHRNPVMRVFCQIVSNEIHKSDDGVSLRPARYRNKWFVLLTLLRNPQLHKLRKHHLGPASVKFIASGDVSVTIDNPTSMKHPTRF